ncbi:MAG: hypothetical protein RI883_1875 [Bacteroidota bacterium]|jgi:hypothetical protein
MKLNIKLTFLAIYGSFCLFSQNVLFTFNDESQIDYNVNQIEKINFDNNFMLVHLTDATIISWDLSIIKNYTHTESGLGVSINSPLNIDPKFSLFPNPTDGLLTVSYDVLTPSMVKILIYNIDGKLCFEKTTTHEVSENKIIDVQLTNFESGTYRCVVESLTQRMSKQFTIR